VERCGACWGWVVSRQKATGDSTEVRKKLARGAWKQGR
jgi:hypothetical protein